MMSLLFAAVTGNMSQLYRYHADNIDFNWSDYDGRTALHLAVCGGNKQAIRKQPNQKQRSTAQIH